MRYFINMFRNDIYFAIKMKHKFDLNESEISYLLGEENAHRLKDILRSTEVVNVKPIEEETVKDTKKDKKENAEKIQQTLFDF